MDQLISKGWGSGALYVLRTVVDIKIRYLSVNFFFIMILLNTVFATQTIASIANANNLSPENTPAEYGNMITGLECGALLLSSPFYLMAGLALRKIYKEKNVDLKEEA